MNLLSLLGLLVGVTLLVHLTHYWRRVPFVFILLGTALLVWNVAFASANSIDILSVTLAFEPASRDLLTLGLGLSGALALATTFQRDRISLSFLFWSWIPWSLALEVNDFVVAVFGWALGMVAIVLAMKPRKYQRASGAAYFLVFVVFASASLLLANRFAVLYPLTPEQTSLISLAILFLTFGLGLLLALFPFHFWVGPLTDDAPLPISALLLGLGQPIGLWLLFRLLSQYSWLSDKSNLFDIIALGGAATVIVGGVMAAFERRAGRLLGYTAMFTLGLALLDVSRATHEGIAYGGMELTARAVGLAVFACAITINQAVEDRWVQRVSLGAFLLAALSLVGVRLGVSFFERWNLITELAGADLRLVGLVLLAHIGVLVGSVRFARSWWLAEQQETEPQPEFAIEEEGEAVREPELVSMSLGASERVPTPATTPIEVAPTPPREEKELSPVALRQSAAGNGFDLNDEAANGDGESANGNRTNSEDEAGGSANDDEAGQEKTASEEYVFEEHVGEIMRVLVARLRPYVRRVLRSLPLGTRDVVLVVWRSWPIWASIALLLTLTMLLIAFAVVPQLWFSRVLNAFSSLPFVQ